jgi:hypothetical protein
MERGMGKHSRARAGSDGKGLPSFAEVNDLISNSRARLLGFDIGHVHTCTVHCDNEICHGVPIPHVTASPFPVL